MQAEPVVTSPAEFATGHIGGAVNIPLDQIGAGIPSGYKLRRDSRILLYCRSGQRSEAARKLLEQQGYLYVLNGGSIEDAQKNLKP